MTILLAILGYLFGSIPFGLILVRAAGLGDIRNIGSGNIGTSNVLRTGRKDLALATLILDAAKGAIAFALAYWLFKQGYTTALIAGFFAVLGHNFSIFLKFKGGKGVATSLGLYAVAAPIITIVTLIIWLIVALITRISSLAAMTALLVTPAVALLYGNKPLALISFLLWGLCMFRHKDNIIRILNGTENKIGGIKD
ncbi:MAG: glycerol-3-phosphate 1-O-acyltransferase PlsY [Alphaproteobacteria bacterium]